jgi:hypothetical protein
MQESGSDDEVASGDMGDLGGQLVDDQALEGNVEDEGEEVGLCQI